MARNSRSRLSREDELLAWAAIGVLVAAIALVVAAIVI